MRIEQLVRGSSERCRVLLLSMIHQRTGVSALPGLRTFPRLSTSAERSLLIIGSVLGGADSSETEMNVLAVSLQRPAQRSVCSLYCQYSRSIYTARFVVWQPRCTADTSTNWRQSLFCCCTASMEQAIDGAETAAIDGLVPS